MNTTRKERLPKKLETEDPVLYRRPMPVTELIIYRNRNSHYVCPRCGTTMEREFSFFCDRCGQKLCWKQYKKARRIFLWKKNASAQNGE